MRWLNLATFFLLIACDAPETAPDPKISHLEAQLALERKSYETTIENLEAELLATRNELESLRDRTDLAELESGAVDAMSADVTELRAQLAAARADAKRYREGLEKAVAELNRLGAQVPVQRAAAPKKRPASTPFVRAPYLSVVGDTAEAAGTINNASSEPVNGYIYVELVKDGRIVDSTRLRVDIAPRTVSNYSATFSKVSSGFGESYSARAEWATQ